MRFKLDMQFWVRASTDVQVQWRGNVFWTGGAQNCKIVSTSGKRSRKRKIVFSNARFQERDTQQTYFDRHQLHARSSDRNFFRIIYYHGKQDCLLPLGFSNYARIVTHVFVKCKIPQ